MDFCNNYHVLLVLLFAKRIILILTIAVPIILLITGMIDMAKATTNAEDSKKHVMNLVKRSASVLMFFLIPTFVSILMGLLGQNNTVLLTCANNINPETIERLKAIDALNRREDNVMPGDSYSTPSKNKFRITVATWNIGRGTKVSNVTASKLAKYIKDYDIDIIGIQEARNRGTNLIKETVQAANMADYMFTNTPAGNAIISSKTLISKNDMSLISCGEARSLQKTVLNLNGTNVSFYNTHLSPGASCPAKQIKDIINKIKNDPNPTILVGDFNVARNCSLIANNLNNQYEIIAYDTVSTGIKCTDSIIISKNRGIKQISKKTIKTDGIITDHNLVITTLEFN